MRHIYKMMLISTLVLFLTWSLNAEDWPNWRGPDHNGVSKETGWLAKCSPKQLEEGPRARLLEMEMALTSAESGWSRYVLVIARRPENQG